MFLKDNGDHLEAINLLNKLEKQGYERSRVKPKRQLPLSELGNYKASRSELVSR